MMLFSHIFWEEGFIPLQNKQDRDWSFIPSKGFVDWTLKIIFLNKKEENIWKLVANYQKDDTTEAVSRV